MMTDPIGGKALPQVLLWGGQSKARIIEEMLKESNVGTPGIIFDNTIDALAFATQTYFTNEVRCLKERLSDVSHYIVCIGAEHGYARVRTAEYLEKLGLQPISLLHSHSFIEPTAYVGRGCQVMPGAIVHKFVEVAEQTIINTNATIDHECIIGKGVHVMGGAAVAGKVEIGDYATIGTNATILPHVKIGQGAFIGAGAVVTKDVDAFSVVAGVPARKLRNTTPKFFEAALVELLT